MSSRHDARGRGAFEDFNVYFDPKPIVPTSAPTCSPFHLVYSAMSSSFHQNTYTKNPVSHFWTWSAGLLGLLLFTGCPSQEQAPPLTPPPVADSVVPHDGGLHFDGRYYDSIEMTPRSPRTERELAIYNQLARLEMIKPYRNKKGQIVSTPKQPNDSIYEQIGEGNPSRGFANEAERLADIHRKIDSLKILEHIPPTPH